MTLIACRLEPFKPASSEGDLLSELSRMLLDVRRQTHGPPDCALVAGKRKLPLAQYEPVR
jgi:hypothetical protein